MIDTLRWPTPLPQSVEHAILDAGPQRLELLWGARIMDRTGKVIQDPVADAVLFMSWQRQFKRRRR